VEDTFQKVWLYLAAGERLLRQDGNVEALTFSAGKPASAPAAPAAAARAHPPAPPAQGAAR
jgi:hypothetical protein